LALNIIKDLRKVYASLNADEIRGQAAKELSVGLMAESDAAFEQMQEFLAPGWLPRESAAMAERAMHVANGKASQYDFVLCEPGIAVPRNGYLFERGEEQSLARLIAEERPELELALARTFPSMRTAVAHRIINRISRENALFSLVTALPNVLPSVMELPWAIGEFATDTAFLTANQIRMALQLAAGYGRPVGYVEQKAELAAIVASAFGWRAIARELVSKIPLGGGLIPKAAVAFAGTWVVGMGLDKVNRTGAGLTREEKREAYAEAFARGKEAAADLAPATLKNSKETA
jgi:hypothetical protein